MNNLRWKCAQLAFRFGTYLLHCPRLPRQAERLLLCAYRVSADLIRIMVALFNGDKVEHAAEQV